VASQSQDDYGALVGWTTKRKDGRVMLRMQCVNKAPPHARGDVHSHFYVMDEQQAVQLGNYLFEITNQTRPSRKGRGLLARLFG